MDLDQTTTDILLLDIYGPMLTERQHSMLRQYLEEDLSLGEISQLEGITRQGVRDSIVKGQTILRETEQKLGLLRKELELHSVLEQLESIQLQINHNELGETVAKLKNILEGDNGI